MNALSSGVRSGLERYLKEMMSDPEVTGAVLAGANGVFCGGPLVDLDRLQRAFTWPSYSHEMHPLSTEYIYMM